MNYALYLFLLLTFNLERIVYILFAMQTLQYFVYNSLLFVFHLKRFQTERKFMKKNLGANEIYQSTLHHIDRAVV